MKRLFLSLAAMVSAAFVFTGCAVNWYELPPDGVEAPAQAIEKEQQIYQQRLKFRKKAYFVGLKTTRNIFYHTWFRTVYAGQVSFVDRFTQELGAQLQNSFGAMRDLELVGLHSNVIDEATFGTDQGSLLHQKLPKPADLMITYKVTNVAVRESAATQTGRLVTGIVGAGLHMGGEHRAGAIVETSGSVVRLYYATVSAEVQMVNVKTGKAVFAYNITVDSLPAPICTGKEIGDCIRKISQKVCANYLYDFGPPVYTTESRSYGKMVQLNIGADYGVVPGMKFRFIAKNEQGHEFQIGTGYVQSGVPDDIGPNYCRVVVDGQGKPEKFRVMKNMLAKPIYMR